MENLCVVGHLNVPDLVYYSVQYKYIEQLLKLKKSGESPVIGTQNLNKVEFYGWTPNVNQHVDNKGYVYFMPLHSDGYVYIDGTKVRIKKGSVVRLYDYVSHGTTNEENVIALFVGAYDTPQDSLALNKIKNYMERMADSYFKVPPIHLRSTSKLYLLPDTVALQDAQGYLTRVIHSIYAKNKNVVKCSRCNATAKYIDSQHPYMQDNTTCQRHQL